MRAGKKVLEVLVFVAAEGDYVLPSDFIAPGEKLPSSFTSFFDEALANIDGDVYERVKKKAAAKLVFEMASQIFKVGERNLCKPFIPLCRATLSIA